MTADKESNKGPELFGRRRKGIATRLKFYTNVLLH